METDFSAKYQKTSMGARVTGLCFFESREKLQKRLRDIFLETNIAPILVNDALNRNSYGLIYIGPFIDLIHKEDIPTEYSIFFSEEGECLIGNCMAFTFTDSDITKRFASLHPYDTRRFRYY